VPADPYTHGHDDAVLRSHRWRTAANSAAYLLPRLRPGASLLDVGCGPGTLTADLAAHVSPGPVVGIDVTKKVVTEALEHVHGRGLSNVTILPGDVYSGSVPGAPFDVVHAHQVLQHLSDPVGALRAMAALAKPGGVVAVRDGDYSAFTWFPADRRLDRWLEIYLEVTRRNGGEANAGRWLLKWALEAGLTDVVYSTSTWTFFRPEDKAWWSELWAERITRTRLAEHAVEYGIASASELEEVAEGWRCWATRPDAVFMVPHGEVLARVAAQP